MVSTDKACSPVNVYGCANSQRHSYKCLHEVEASVCGREIRERLNQGVPSSHCFVIKLSIRNRLHDGPDMTRFIMTRSKH